ncbi:uncharacterized protein AMSG_03949 [Thecamonas trahens ATCC 50062]|uniref:Uncharacterized protein n=1 Tax=Thecamonas trahens ATCC 50062 TaxID=461836 RepID=A0A0L0D8U9_THETB|nr:hypothetical protein AMSG_03949 [Thecamonas trahens ATCC 50062]KNC47718.1 hypothetical protein AMSG_03949 [Thecamonas trahens ATCC 50062]|eukprot:XP_013759200.1 hypothetical protein AMSG_03949 [Thecamonas trahens ATCC 50062]
MDVDELFNAGEDAFEEGEYMAASRVYSEILEIDPEYVMALVRRAECFMHLRMNQLALTDAHLACAAFADSVDFRDPERIVALHTLAKVLAAAEHWPQALDAYEHVCSIMPESDVLRSECDEVRKRAEGGRQRTSRVWAAHLIAAVSVDGREPRPQRQRRRRKKSKSARGRRNRGNVSRVQSSPSPHASAEARFTGDRDPLQDVLVSKGVSTPSPHTYRHYHVRVVPSPLRGGASSASPSAPRSPPRSRALTPGARSLHSPSGPRRSAHGQSVVRISPTVASRVGARHKLNASGLGAWQGMHGDSYVADVVADVADESRDALGAVLRTTPHLGLHTFRQEVRASVRPQMRALFTTQLRTGSSKDTQAMLRDSLVAEDEVGKTSAVSLTASRKK